MLESINNKCSAYNMHVIQWPSGSSLNKCWRNTERGIEKSMWARFKEIHKYETCLKKKLGNWYINIWCLVVFHSLRHIWLFVTPCTEACQASPSFTISWSLLKLLSIESVLPSNHLILCCHLLLPSVFSNIKVFSNESALLIRWPRL